MLYIPMPYNFMVLVDQKISNVQKLRNNAPRLGRLLFSPIVIYFFKIFFLKINSLILIFLFS